MIGDVEDSVRLMAGASQVTMRPAPRARILSVWLLLLSK